MSDSIHSHVHHSKSRTSYILCACFGGFIGIQSFYAGDQKKAALQLVLGLLSFGILSSLWALIDIFTIKADAHGHPFL